jgi:hypothetical protein
MDEPPSNTPTRWLPRFSLLTMILLTTIVGLTMVIVQLWREVGPLRKEVRRLRDEMGVLTVEDPTRLHAIEVRTKDEMIWKWRVWIPERAKTVLKLSWGSVPLDGYRTAADITTDELAPGEQWITVTVRKAAGIDKWQCVLERSPGSAIFLPISEDKQWFLTPNYDMVSGGVGTKTRMDDAEDGRNTFLLKRHRVQLKRKPVRALDDPDPLPGFMLWLESK